MPHPPVPTCFARNNDRSEIHETDTGNTCKHIGYDEFNPPSWPGSCAPNKEDWIELNRYVCGTNEAYPEEFWACSDISLTSGGCPFWACVFYLRGATRETLVEKTASRLVARLRR